MNELQRFVHYSDFKRAMDKELHSLADNVVRIGYLLKQARDTDVLRESGYNSVADFAKAEYNMSPDAVSRYIHINDRFSEGGNSDRLDSRFCSFGYTKLADMLALPDKLAEEVPAEATRAEIRELAKEVKEEQKITDLELLMESPQVPEECLLDCVLREAARRDVRMFTGLCAAAEIGDQRDVYETLAPTGVIMSMVRVPGVGRLALTVKSPSEPVALTNVRENSRTDVAWDEMMTAVRRVFAGESPEEIYRRLYGAELPQSWTQPEAAAEDTTSVGRDGGKTAEFAPAQKKAKQEQKKPGRGKIIRIAGTRETVEEEKPVTPAETGSQDNLLPEDLVAAAEAEEADELSELLEQLNRIREHILHREYAASEKEAKRLCLMLEAKNITRMEREDESVSGEALRVIEMENWRE